MPVDAEAQADAPQKPALVKVALQPGALPALCGNLRAYIAAKQQSLLAMADRTNSTAQTETSDAQLSLQFKVCPDVQ